MSLSEFHRAEANGAETGTTVQRSGDDSTRIHAGSDKFSIYSFIPGADYGPRSGVAGCLPMWSGIESPTVCRQNGLEIDMVEGRGWHREKSFSQIDGLSPT
jgi:hypothetical protein